jgi:hypothetical protein
VQVAEVARQQVGHDVPPTDLQQLVAAGEALEDQLHVARLVALADQVLARAHLAGAAGDLGEQPPVDGGQRREGLELAGERVGHARLLRTCRRDPPGPEPRRPRRIACALHAARSKPR